MSEGQWVKRALPVRQAGLAVSATGGFIYRSQTDSTWRKCQSIATGLLRRRSLGRVQLHVQVIGVVRLVGLVEGHGCCIPLLVLNPVVAFGQATPNATHPGVR